MSPLKIVHVRFPKNERDIKFSDNFLFSKRYFSFVFSPSHVSFYHIVAMYSVRVQQELDK